MPRIPDKNVNINGRSVGANSTIKLSIKTAVWLIGIVFSLVMGILTYSYFDLKGKYGEFVNSVDTKVEKIQTDVTNIRIGQEGIRGDIKLILYKQDQESSIKPTNQPIAQPVVPPPIMNVVPDTMPPPE